jgi:hypothetical protein
MAPSSSAQPIDHIGRQQLCAGQECVQRLHLNVGAAGQIMEEDFARMDHTPEGAAMRTLFGRITDALMFRDEVRQFFCD